MNTTIKFFALSALLPLAIACGSSKRSVVPADHSYDETIDIGYGTITKKANTYASGSVKINENEISTYATVFDYLRGRVPGLEVTANNKIIIRGLNSIYGSSEPLIIVDGVEVEDISNLNPRDIGNINVLKDGSASIYGARGGNGVIIINTKR